MRYYTTRPYKLLFPSVVLTGITDGVYLTFDDGPHPVATPALLDCLKARNARATFFLLGKNVERYPELALRIAREGHSVGNHGFDHTSLLFRTPEYIADQINRTEAAIQRATGIVTNQFRPPYGYIGPTLYRSVQQLNYRLTLWDIDAGDFQKVSTDTIVRRVTANVKPGSIVLFHDNDRTQHRITEIVGRLLDSPELLPLSKKSLAIPSQAFAKSMA